MSKILTVGVFSILFAFIIGSVTTGCGHKSSSNSKSAKEFEASHDKYDGPDKAIAFEVERTRDLSTGKVPWEKLFVAMQQTESSKRNAANRTEALLWQERGPDGDFNGPSANSRPNMDQTSGRVRAAMVDSLDPTRKTVFVGSVSGGLWKTTDITTAPANWILVNDQMANLAIADICQDPRPGFQNIMYCCTGESYSNIDAVRGAGVFKSVDGGNSWNFLSNTTNYVACTRILCDYLGNVYLGTRSTGLLRSSDGGANWITITPAGLNNDICDMEISSTAAAGRLHVCTGIGSTQGYRYTDAPSTITSSGWTAPTTTFVSGSARAEIAVMGNVLYALPVNSSDQVASIYKSVDGGDNWAVTGGQPSPASWVNQGWYCVTVAINPSNPDECIVGGLDCHKTTNGGTSWTKISTWASTVGQYVHADQHDIQWWDGGSKLLFASDGGMHFSSNGGTTIRDRNKGLRIKQFYSVAIHPTLTNYFLAGAQDNGVHRLHHPGLDSSIEVTGGDGAYVAIDQDEGQFQFGSYVYNVYRRSTNGGGSWSTPVNNQTTGRFINPWDYDNTGNKIYACNNANSYLRWNDPQTGSSTQVISMTAFAGGNVSAVHVSPYTANRVFFGTGIGGIIQVDHAEGATPAGTMINSGSGMSGYVNCVATGSDDQHLVACMTNYNMANNIWVTSNGGTTWTGIEGNLPNMPVRWAMFHPDTDTKVFIATETGVWETDLINGSSTIWTANSGFPNCRTDMLKYRAADRTIAAGTHGRGVWSATVPVVPGFSFTTPAPATASCPVPASMQTTIGTTSIGGFSTLINLSATAGVPVGTSVSFSANPITPEGGSSVVTLNNTNTLAAGTYSITVTGTAGSITRSVNVNYTINPGTGPTINTHPLSQAVCDGSNVSFSVDATGTYQWQLSTNNGSTWTNIGSAMASAYSLTGVTVSQNANQYRCVVTNSCGSINSNAAVLTVNAIPPKPVITAGGPLSLCTGANVVLTSSSATGNQWYKDAVLISGETNQTYTATTAGNYTVIVTASGCVSPTSLATVVTISAPPATPVINWNGSQLSTAAGFASYQWYLNSIAISGATSATHSPVFSGLYRVSVTNTGGCSATSADFNLVATAVNNLTLNGVQFSLSPNPANDVINIKVNGNNAGKVQLRIISINGAEMMRIDNISSSASLLVSNYPAGMYYILLNGKKENGAFKVIIKH